MNTPCCAAHMLAYRCHRSHLQRLCQLVSDGQLAVVLDPHRFEGLPAVPEAVELLQSGSSSGKVVVQLSNSLPDGPAGARL
jgi:NADPH-dependent curcumin reductase CurA